ncbi:LysR substrate-binding domain-containing protein [Microvirga puerhi]|uniref:LysR family transcriptional regulator n=1 Tax=Microvirga puerhi TaxID=2876078 RepID=A0ABS7VVV7_9HYPH|nr:LysR substrate-binding domain-containing protein [Microvirga puerhi]MBZ6078998.1 LysR family transcriptional regulator [Microvirga puerhi]
MELAWFEDFLELVATRNFSTAALARSISQPAFSRRIKSLEAWIGADLIDRSTYPVHLTDAGNVFLPRCQEQVREMYRLRTDCRNAAGASSQLVTFAALHTLSIYFFPTWMSSPQMASLATRSSMHAADFMECIEHLSSNRCDFAITYDHPDGPPVLKTGPFESLLLGTDRLILVSKVDSPGKPLYDIDRSDGEEIPFLAYSWNDGYLGKIISLIRSRWRQPLNLSTVYQSSLAESLKHMVMAGHGVAWLPQSCARKGILDGELVQIGGQQMSLAMEIRIFRRAGPLSRAGEQLWKHLLHNAERRPGRDLSIPR